MDEYNKGRSDITELRGSLKESNHFSKEMMVELYEIPEDDPIRSEILVRRDEWDRWPQGVLLKLVTLGYLVPESKLTKYYLFQERLELLEQDTKRDLFDVVKAKMVKYADPPADGVERIVRTFVKNYRDSPYRLRVDRRENLYAQSAINRLEEGNPLWVDHPYPLKDKFRRVPPPMTVYQEKGLELYEWFLENFSDVRNGEFPFSPPPTDILEDDPIIIDQISNGGADVFIISTDDVKLYKLALNKFPDTWIFRMSARHHFELEEWCQQEQTEMDMAFEDSFYEEFQKPLTVSVLEDRGSLESWNAKYIGTPDGKTFFQTVGIPWRKDICRENLEKKPMHGFLERLKPKSLRELQFPRFIMDERTVRTLRRTL